MVLALERGLTTGARVTMMAAHQKAARTGAAYVRADHVLVALMERPDDSVRSLLHGAGTDPASLLAELRERVAGQPAVDLAVDAVAQMVIADAGKEADALGADRIDDIHLLLGLLRDPSDAAGQALTSVGLTLDGARSAVRQSQMRRAVEADRVVAWSPNTATSRKTGLRSPSDDGVLTVRGPRPGWSRQTHLPSNGWARLRAASNLSPIFCALLGVMIGSGALLATIEPTERAARLLIIAFIVSGWVASVCIHEYGHAAAAFLGGDREVADMGGLSLDPRNYMSPLFSVVLPLAFLLMGRIPLPGGAVMIRTSALRSRRWDLAVSASGPLGSLVCLVLFSTPFLLGLHDRWPDRPYLWAALAGLASVETVSLVLTLLPIPPLDGFHIVAYWLPDDVRASARQLGWMPVIALYVLLSQDSPISDAFWSFGYGLGDILQIPRWFAWYGLDQLRL